MSSRQSTIFAINGLGGLEFLWDELKACLAPKHRLIVLDLPGHGDSPSLPDYHYAALVDDAVSRIGPQPAFPLLGWSVGATVAWLLAARHPALVSHLVLIEPAAPHQSPFRFGPVPDPVHAFTFASIEKGLEALGAVYPGVTVEAFSRLYRQNALGRWEPRFDPAIYGPLVEDARDLGEELGLELSHVRCPVLVIRAERSFLTEAMATEIAGLISRSSYETIPAAGHFVLKDKPQEVAGLITTFLARS